MADIGDLVLYVGADIASYESSMKTVRTTAESTAEGVEDAFEDIDKSTTSSSTTTQKSSSKSAAAMGTMAGVAQTVVTKAFDAVVNSVGDAASRLDTLESYPTVMQNLGYSSEDAQASIDKMADALDGLPTSLDSLTSITSTLAPVSSSLGEATDIAIAFNDALLAGGQSTAIQENAMAQLTQAVSTGTFELDGFRSVMEAMPGQLNQVAQHLLGAESGAYDLYYALQDGTLSMEDFTSAMVLLDTQGTSSFTSFQQQAQDATGGINSSWENMKTSITRGVAEIMSSIGSSNISDSLSSIGTAIENVLNAIAPLAGALAPTAINIFTTALNALQTPLEWMANNSTAVITALGLLAAGFTAMKIVQSISSFVTAFKTALDLAKTSMTLFNLVLNANPLMLIVTAITAVIAALTWFFTQTETGRQLWESFTSFLSSAWENIKNVASTVWNWISSTISTVWNNISSTISSVINSIKSTISNVWNTIKSTISNAINNIKSTISNGFTTAKNTVTNIFSNAVNWLKDTGKNIITGLWNGISNAKDWILGKISGWVDSVLGGIKSFFGISSPSVIMEMEVGAMIPPGIAEGIEDTATVAVTPMVDLVDDMTSISLAGFETIGDSLPLLEAEALYEAEAAAIGADDSWFTSLMSTVDGQAAVSSVDKSRKSSVQANFTINSQDAEAAAAATLRRLNMYYN